MNIIISGAGEVGSHLAKMLGSASNDITVIDMDETRLQNISSSSDIVVVEGSPSSIEVLKTAGAQNADLFIAVYPGDSQDINIVSALLAKKLGSKKVTARINNEEYMSYENKYMFTEMGIDLMFYPEKIAAREIMSMLRRSSSCDSMDFSNSKLQMAVFKLEDDSPLLETSLEEFDRCTGVSVQFRVVAISRGNTTFIPSFDTRFKYHDMVFIIARNEGMEMLKRYVGTNDIDVNSVMIAGGGPIALMVARSLLKERVSVKLIEKDKDNCRILSEKLPPEAIVINGDCRNTDLLLEENIRSFDAFVALTDSSETNVLSCVAAKKMGVAHTVAQVENLEYISLAEGMGVDSVINKKMITAGRIFKFTLSDKVRFVKYMSGTNAEIVEFIVAPDSRITKGPLKDLAFPENAKIGGVIRGNDSFIAIGSTRIQPYDRVAVFAMPEVIREVDKWFK